MLNFGFEYVQTCSVVHQGDVFPEGWSDRHKRLTFRCYHIHTRLEFAELYIHTLYTSSGNWLYLRTVGRVERLVAGLDDRGSILWGTRNVCQYGSFDTWGTEPSSVQHQNKIHFPQESSSRSVKLTLTPSRTEVCKFGMSSLLHTFMA